MRKLIPIGGHKIRRRDRAKQDHVTILTLITFYAYGARGIQCGEGLGDFFVMSFFLYFFYKNCICFAENLKPLRSNLAKNTNPQSRPREWMAPDGIFWQTKFFTKSPHFIFEKLLERFHDTP